MSDDATRLKQGAYRPLPDRTKIGAPPSDADVLDAVAPQRVSGEGDYMAQFYRTPSTQNGMVPDQDAKHVQETFLGKMQVDPVNLADPPDRAMSDVVYPSPGTDGPGPERGGTSVGPGSLGTDIDGWHPAPDNGGGR